MKKLSCFIAIVALSAAAASAAPVSATAVLNGGSFLQTGSITNTAVSANIISFIYSLGAPEDNIATWDGNTGGGTASDFLANPQFFQTVTFSGLNILPGGSFNFGGLDIDLIVTVAPLSVTGAVLDVTGESLRNASVGVVYDSGQTASAALLQTPWASTQTLTLNEDNVVVPEPSSALLLAGGAFGLMLLRRKRS